MCAANRVASRRRPERCRRVSVSCNPARRRERLLSLLSALLASGTLLVGCDASRKIDGGAAFERALGAAEQHEYLIELEPGELLRLEVDQRDLDLQAVIVDPAGREVVRAESQGVLPPRSLALIAEQAGEYRLRVRALDASAPDGIYRVHVRDLRRAEARDRAWQAAEARFKQGERLQLEDTRDNLRQAIEEYKEALRLSHQAADAAGAAKAEIAIGNAYRLLKDHEQALAHFESGLELRRRIGDAVAEADALSEVADALRRIEPEDLQPAIDLYFQTIGRLRDAAREAEPGSLRRRLLDSTLALILNNLATTYRRQDKYEEALRTHQQSLQLRRGLGDRQAIGRSLINLGVAYGRSGQNRQALGHYHEALSLLEGTDECRGVAALYSNLGTTYERLGQYERARRYFCRALPLRIGLGRSNDVAVMLSGLGRALHFSRREREALDSFERALTELGPEGSIRTRATILVNAGRSHYKLREYPEALELFEEALAIWQRIGSRRSQGILLSEIANVYRERQDLDRAFGLYRQALELSRNTGDRSTEALTLLRMADADQRRDRPASALAHLKSGLAIIEAGRSEVADPHHRAAFQSFKNRFYELHLDLLMALHARNPGQGFDARAFRASESARARSLVYVLEGQIEVGQGVDPSLLESMKAHETRLGRLERNRRRLVAEQAAPSELAKAQEEIEATLARWDQLRALIFQSSPSYQQLTEPEALGVEEIRSLLDPDTVLLEIALGRDRGFWWMITADSFESGELPPREQIESLARRIYSLVEDRSAWDESEYLDTAGELSDLLLEPIAGHLDHERLVLVGDGALQYVPFAALPVPAGAVDGARDASVQQPWIPLVARHEIVSLPSASVLDLLRREASSSDEAVGTLAVIADPVFGAEPNQAQSVGLPRDLGPAPCISRGRSPAGGELASLAPTCMASNSPSDESSNFPRLVFSGEEARALIANVRGDGAQAFLGHEATRERVMNGELSSYRIVHFATHGVLDTEHPELSALVLSQVDPRGRPIEGHLRLHDIYKLELNAELVVLSACRTALGKELRGEGLIGLTRGFMYAGAPRVVASLWAVDDKATLRLMDAFYRFMLNDGLRPAAALNRAQKAMWQAGRPPYEWAAFALQGEWR